MGMHRCPECGYTWPCMSEDCDYDGEEANCRICTGRENDCNPDTRMKYPGAFKEWEKSVI